MPNHNKKNILNNKLYDGNINTTGNGYTNEANEGPSDKSKQDNGKSSINRSNKESEFKG